MAQIQARLHTLDPDNGLVALLDLLRLQDSGDDAAVTDALTHIGTSPRISLYWSPVVLMVNDALSGGPKGSLRWRSADDRSAETAAFGVAASAVIPPLRKLSHACASEMLSIAGRRAVCESVAARLEQADTLLMQDLGLDMERRWWPAGSVERVRIDARRRQLDYVVMQADTTHWWRARRYTLERIESMRQTPGEEGMALAMLRRRHISSNPPEGWKDPLAPRD